MPSKINITDKRFGILTAIRPSGGSRSGSVLWECLCDCGQTKITTAKLLRRGECTSCGCLKLNRAMAHVRKKEKPIGYTRVKKSNGRTEIKTERWFVFEHVWIMEQSLGRRLLKSEVVHHKDGNKFNNDISNLEVMTSSEHTKLHHTGARRSESTRRLISERKITMRHTRKESVCITKQ